MTTTSLSVDEFFAGDFPEGSELFEGTVWVNEPSFRHQEACMRILLALNRAGAEHIGYGGNWKVNERTLLKPDVWWVDDTVWAQTRTEVMHAGLPQLAVEVRSPGTWVRDIGPKRTTYMSSGVRELWLVDTLGSSVIVVEADGSPLGAARELNGGVLTTTLIPAFALALDELFAT